MVNYQHEFCHSLLCCTMPILHSNIRTFNPCRIATVTQLLFYSLYMHMYFVLTRTMAVQHKTISNPFISLLDIYTIKFIQNKKRKEKETRVVLSFTVLQYHHFQVICQLMQGNNMSKEGYRNFLSHVRCLESHCLLSALKTVLNRKWSLEALRLCLLSCR